MRPRTIQTDRLLLRSFRLSDAPDVHRLAGERDVAATALDIPHPMELWMAEEWIRICQQGRKRGDFISFAIVLRTDRSLIGSIGLVVNREHARAELGYWVGMPYWNAGYCTEAAQAVIEYGFDELHLNRIHSNHFTGNPASGRVMQKCGMTYEGRARQHVKHWGTFEDLELYAILRDDYRRNG